MMKHLIDEERITLLEDILIWNGNLIRAVGNLILKNIAKHGDNPDGEVMFYLSVLRLIINRYEAVYGDDVLTTEEAFHERLKAYQLELMNELTGLKEETPIEEIKRRLKDEGEQLLREENG